MRQLDYIISFGITGINMVTVYDKDKLFCEIEVLADSPYSTEEEIQNWLDDNGYEDGEFEFNRLKQ